MKITSILLLPLFFFFSCSKENVLPDDYQYLIGNWVLDNYVVSSYSYYPYSCSDTLPSDSLGHNLSIKIDDNSIAFYSEKTIVQIVNNYISVEVNTRTYSGLTHLFFYLIYRDEMGRKRASSLIYIPSLDVIHVLYHLYDSETGSYDPIYEFNYSRE